MSGGEYDYAYEKIEEFANRITTDTRSSCGGASGPVLRMKFKEHLQLVAKAAKAIEWNDSGDGDDNEEELIKTVLGFVVD